MRVEKRDGSLEEVSFDKVTHRIKNKCLQEPICNNVDYVTVAQQVIQRIYEKVPTRQLDELTANILISMSTIEPEYSEVASRIIISNNHKNTIKTFTKLTHLLYDNQLMSKLMLDVVEKYGDLIEKHIDYSRDYLLSYFGFKTLENSYLKRVDNKVVERPQHLWMRLGLSIHMTDELKLEDLYLAFETYDVVSTKKMIHATPTLFSCGTPKQTMLSCFLIGNTPDSIEGIYECAKDCALISKAAGGIGINVSNVRSKGSKIRSQSGGAQGLIPMLKVFNDTALYVNQCFTPDTVIYTKNGSKRACDILVGDNVITLDGSYKPVLQVVTNNVDKEILKIKTPYSFKPTKCTSEHQIYTIPTPDPKLSVKTVLEQNIEPIYIEAGNLKKGDLVGFPMSNENHTLVDSKYLEFYGLWLTSGFDCKTYMSIDTNIRPEYEPIRDTIRSYLKSINVKYVEQSRPHKKDIKIRWDINFFKDNDRNLTTISPKYFGLSSEDTKLLLDSMLKPLKNRGNVNNRNINIKVENYGLVVQIKQLFMKIGVLVKGYKNGQDKWVINVPNKLNGDYIIRDNIIWTRIKTIDKQHYKGLVYDFNIEDNHNYLTDIGIVHNSGNRNGSFAIYCEPSHPDFMDFLELKKNTGVEALRCRDLFYAIWMPDLFMERVKANEMWSFMDPDECKGLNDSYGDKYRELYLKYESEGKYRSRLPAQQIWIKILHAQIETGNPYIVYKDSLNYKSNHKHLGTIKTSNLCAEIAEYSDEDEYACCTLASIGLPAFVKDDHSFDFVELSKVVKIAVRNLNKIIDLNVYPLEKTETSNKRHRPIGIGVQGLADVYIKMRYPFSSAEASLLNKQIFATIYWASLTASANVVDDYKLSNKCENKCENKWANKWDIEANQKRIENNTPNLIGAYSTFEGSPISKGLFQFDLWGAKPLDSVPDIEFKWDELRSRIVKYGIRNSLLVAPMPTASTSQILGYNECFEPITSNIYTRSVLAGEFIVVNNYLVRDLQNLGLWNATMKDRIILDDGSIEKIEEIPRHIRDLYKTSYDLSMKPLIDQSADRSIYICQTQSLNLYMSNPKIERLTSMHFYAWEKGLKTGLYYLRARSIGKAQTFTIDPELEKYHKETKEIKVCKRNDASCMMCSS